MMVTQYVVTMRLHAHKLLLHIPNLSVQVWELLIYVQSTLLFDKSLTKESSE